MKDTNALIHETSPYLLQHAHNPVDWYPWGDKAFEKARREQKPVFLSIGYSTCHWCHVMERESFEDAEVAAMLNDAFVSIKVDKEERPDVDAVYMNVCQAVTGSGGWPLTIIMTPDQKPFFAGTYFPKHRRFGQPGLLELLQVIRQKWQDDRAGLLDAGQQVADALGAEAASPQAIPDGKQVVETAFGQLARSFDETWGGFGRAPKFPQPHQLLFLLRCHYLGVGDGLAMVEKTLSSMYRGGIYDHIGGGFSRYSTDERWLVPHFEKMLYDNALLVTALLECYQVTGDKLYSKIAEHTLAYIRREMTAPEGGFYCAQDADIDGEEGKFYTFSKKELLDVLGAEQGEAFCAYYSVTGQGNFEGKNILNLLHPEIAALPGSQLENCLQTLLDYREKRYRLHKDDKILTAWNALMIAACAKAYRVLGEESYLQMAVDAFRFLRHALQKEDGTLAVSYRGGKTTGTGLLDDYAFLAWACLELYESTFDVTYLEQAASLMEQILRRFHRKEGGFYLSPEDGEPLLFRPVEQYDGAVPSGNSAAAWCLARLAALTGDAHWQDAAERQLLFYGELLGQHPTACSFALLALLQQVFPSQELLCALPDDSGKEALARRLGSAYHPQTAVLAKSPADGEALAALAPYTASYPTARQAAFYLCHNRSCSAPVSSVDEVLSRLCQK